MLKRTKKTLSGILLATMIISVAITEFVIYGLESAEIRIKNLTANVPHVIDGCLFLYLKGGTNDSQLQRF